MSERFWTAICAATDGVSARAWDRAVLAAMLVHCALTATLALLRFATVHNRTFDLALYGRMAWGLTHGEAWDPIVGGHFLGGHVPLVMVPLAWIGRLLGTVPVLLLTQSLAVALAAWPLSRIAERRMGPAAGFAAALAFLLYPNLGHVATYEMHPGTLAVWPLCAALDALDRQRPVALCLLCAAAVACRASLSLQTIMLGLLALWGPPRLRRAGMVLIAGSAAYFAFAQFWLQPRFGGALAGSLDLHFGRWGGSPLGVVSALLDRPASVLSHFSTPERLSYPLRILLPLALLPLLRPRWLLCALPPVALNLVSEFPTTPMLYSHYLTPAVPALVAAAVDGLDAARARRAAILALLVTSLAGSVIAGGLPWSRDFDPGAFHADAATGSRQHALAAITPGASVQAPDALLPHLCERRIVHRAPPPPRGTDFVVLDIDHRRRFARQETLLRTTEEPVMRRWLSRADHALVAQDERLLVLQRGGTPRSGLARRYLVGTLPPSEGVALTDCLAIRAAELGESLRLEFVARGACPADLAVRLGSARQPTRVDLLFEGCLSPVHLRAGDRLRSPHALSPTERAAILASGLHVGLLRASGAPPRSEDPVTVPVALTHAPGAR
jgi:uncharacterized membrane protein